MPLVPASEALVERVRQFRKEAAYHKAEMYRHKGELRRVKTTLATLEAECFQRGLSLNPVQRGVGDIHGPTIDDTRPPS